MDAELKSLEEKVNQFVTLCQRLRADNHQLRQQLASAQNENMQLSEKIADAKGMQISIMGREFRVACTPDEQKALLEAVDYLNRKMQEIKEQGKVTGLDRIAVMAALTISHEFLTTRLGNFDVSEFKRRMASIETKLDQGLAGQEKLF